MGEVSRSLDLNLTHLVNALCGLRDSWMKLSLTLRDIQFELDSYKPDEVMTEVETWT
jgi:hypothetical protein